MSSKRKDFLNMVAVGDTESGKSSLLSVLKDGKVLDSSVPLVFDTFSLKIKVDGHKVELGLWDTSGGDEYEGLRRLSYPNCDVFLVCYSVGSRKSFERVKTKWLPEVKKYRPTTPFILVGTKRDLRPRTSLMRDGSVEDRSKPRFVNCDEGMMLAHDLGACSFLECSALGGSGVKEVFQEASRAAFKGVDEEKSKTKSEGRSNSLLGRLKK